MKLMAMLAVVCSSVFAAESVWAGDLEWSGNYRIEGVKVNGPDMNGSTRNKQYMLHHLVLTPRINAYDGLTIVSRFDILNANGYENSQLGQFFGSGVGTGTGANASNSNVLSDNQKAEMLYINHLYLNYAHEFGLLTVGRAPVHFGLGMSYNNGSGAFDHWFDNRDLVSYKFVTGNLSVMPVVAKIAENNNSADDDVNDYMVQLMYENPETDLKIGVLYRKRIATRYGNDTPSPIIGDPTSTPTPGVGPFKGEYWNFFISRYVTESFRFGLEVGTQKGDAGIQNTGSDVSLDGLGAALELDYIPKGGKFHAFLRAGMATGDDPNTPNTYEGYIFDRNYDVAFLLFNHPMGAYDVFRTGAERDTSAQPSTVPDVEAISNVLYIAPSFKYRWTESFEGQFGLTYAQLNTDPISNAGVDKAVGYEFDVTLTYRPHEKVQWVNRFGIFSPGDAFKGGTNDFKTDTVYGLETKAAITF